MKNKLELWGYLLMVLISGCIHPTNIPRQHNFFKQNSKLLDENKNNHPLADIDRKKENIFFESLESEFRPVNLDDSANMNVYSPQVSQILIKKNIFKNHQILDASTGLVSEKVNLRLNQTKKSLNNRTHVATKNLKKQIADKPEASESKLKIWPKVLSVLALCFAIAGVIVFALGVISFLSSTVWYAIFAVLYGAMAAGISSLLSLLFSAIVVFGTDKKADQYKKARSRASYSASLAILVSMICGIIILTFM
jgi:hypothetical protein